MLISLSNFCEKGDDDVAICKTDQNGEGAVYHYHNTGNVMPGLLDPQNPTIGFTNIKVSYVDGNLLCSFTRQKSMEGVENYFSLYNMSYYLLTARGTSSGILISSFQSYLSVLI